MPRSARFPYARPRRRSPARIGVLALAGAATIMLVIPFIVPAGRLLDLVGSSGSGAAAVGQESTPAAGTVPPAAPGSFPPGGSPAAPGAGGTPEWTLIENPGLTAPPPASLVGYAWPIAHPRLTLPFGPTGWGSRLVDGQRFHDGVDLATFCGDRIGAAHDGTVLAAGRHYDQFMGWVGDLGPYLRRLDQKHLWMTLPNVVVIDDGNGYRSVYAHFGRVVVKVGQQVTAGQLIGYEGMTGRASGCHLHYDLFSPQERSTMAIVPDVVQRMKVPATEIARIDPLSILPPKPGINAPATPKPSPSASPGASPAP